MSKRLSQPDHNRVSCSLISSKARMDSMLIPALNLFLTRFRLRYTVPQLQCLTLGTLDVYRLLCREVGNEKRALQPPTCWGREHGNRLLRCILSLLL